MQFNRVLDMASVLRTSRIIYCVQKVPNQNFSFKILGTDLVLLLVVFKLIFVLRCKEPKGKTKD